MAASDHLQHEQLRLFVQAKELMDYPTYEGQSAYHDGDPTTLRSNTNLQSRKLRNAKAGYEHYTHGSELPKGGKTLYQSILEKGVEHPILLSYHKTLQADTIINGHHRIAAANDINPEMYLPIRHER